MPDPEGRLSPAEIEYILGWVQRHHGGTMPVCSVSLHTDRWFVVPFVGQFVIYPSSPAKTFPDIPFPFVTLLCTACGYYMHINAALMGLYPPVSTTGGTNAATS